MGTKRTTRSKPRSAPRRPAARADAALGENNYGKSCVRLLKVSRRGRVHTLRDLTVDVALTGAFGPVHTAGDNSRCLPTDTMKNTVYALGKDHPIDSIESFAIHLAKHFVATNDDADSARVRIAQAGWRRLRVRGREHPHAFSHGGEERDTCEATATARASRVVGGITGLVVLKSTDSAFSGFKRDPFTTLADTRDRIFATSVTATWTFASARPERIDFATCRDRIRTALLETFAQHRSESVQHTLFAMGERAIRACRSIDRIRLSMPNRHCILVNLEPFGRPNDNEIFVPTPEPFGLIEATVERR